MKLRNLFEIIGFKAPVKRYGYEMVPFAGPDYEGLYAQWRHPREKPKTIDPAIVNENKKYIREGDFCIDIGAHTGDSTIPMAIAAGKTGLVLALEPNPYVFPVLEKNARANRKSMNILPLMAAAASADQVIELEYSDAGYCNGGKHEGISVFRHGHAYKLLAHGVNLSQELRDDFKHDLPNLKFIKTDAEGFDLYILESIKDIIAEFKPYVKAEVFKHTSKQYRHKMLNFFKELNYRVYVINSDSDYLGYELTEQQISLDKNHYDIFCIPTHKHPALTQTD